MQQDQQGAHTRPRAQAGSTTKRQMVREIRRALGRDWTTHTNLEPVVGSGWLPAVLVASRYTRHELLAVLDMIAPDLLVVRRDSWLVRTLTHAVFLVLWAVSVVILGIARVTLAVSSLWTKRSNDGKAYRAVLRADGWYIVWEDEDGNLYHESPWNQKPMSEGRARRTARRLTKQQERAQVQIERFGAHAAITRRERMLWWCVITLLMIAAVALLLVLVRGLS